MIDVDSDSDALYPSSGASLFLFLFFVPILRTSTVIEIPDIVAVEQLFLQALVHLVVNMATPGCSGGSTRYLRWKFLKDLPEVLGAFSAGVQSLKQMNIRS